MIVKIAGYVLVATIVLAAPTTIAYKQITGQIGSKGLAVASK